MTYPSTIAKVALGVVGASTAAGAGFGIHSALQDKTISDAILRKGKKLINNKDVFEIAFKQRKTDDNFLALIGIQNNSLETTTLEFGGVALSNWCSKNLTLDLTEENIQKVLPNAEKYCSLPPLMNMREKLKDSKKELTEDWGAKIKAVWTDPNDELRTILATNNPSISSKSSNPTVHPVIWKNALEGWCKEKANIPLTWDKNDDIFKKMEKYCFK